MPNAPPKPCPKHPKTLLGRGMVCPHCPTHNWREDRGSRHKRGYGKEWDKLRKVIMARDMYLCQPCIKIGKTTAAQQVDHIIPKAKQGTDSHDNLQAICTKCHEAKTLREQNKKPKTEYGPDGLPTDNHHWLQRGRGR